MILGWGPQLSQNSQRSMTQKRFSTITLELRESSSKQLFGETEEHPF